MFCIVVVLTRHGYGFSIMYDTNISKIVLLDHTSFELLYSGFRHPIRACENCKAKRW